MSIEFQFLFRLIFFVQRQINSLNVEIGQFLYNLRRFADRPDRHQIVIGKNTIDLLLDTVSFIEELIANAELVEVPNEMNTDFLQELDSSHLELRRNAMCLLCDVNLNVL